MSEIWFSADTHFGHTNVIKYCNRPFTSAGEMDAKILDNFAHTIKPGDTLYHLGDVAWSTFDSAKRFFSIFKNTHLIFGNHDKPLRKNCPAVWSGDLKHINPGHPIVLCHYAMRSWQGRASGSIQLYGHSHGTLPGEGRQMDVGVDTNNFMPYHLDEILARLKDVPYKEYE